jgi:hypothetical protein
MKIGIDISQLAYANTGVANYLRSLVENLLATDKENEYVLFYSSLRRNFQFSIFNFHSNPNVSIRQFKFPPTLLDLLWNKLHILPVENLIGDVDIFISSDWTEPPTKKAKKATILYDLIIYKSPKETARKIIETQKRKLYWTKKECDVILCISESTKRDAVELLGISEEKLQVAYPGL